ncbi:MAG: alpha-L-fucosidase C-terminal domain-containing protein, partial [Bacteroidota bacterium]
WKIYGEGPTKVAGGAFSDDKDKPFTADDVRFTTKGDNLFAIALDQPKKDLLVKALSLASGNGKVKSVELLGSTEKMNWSQTKTALVIKPSAKYPSENAVTYKIILEK